MKIHRLRIGSLYTLLSVLIVNYFQSRCSWHAKLLRPPGGILSGPDLCSRISLSYIFHFFIQTGEEKFLSSFFCASPLAVSGYQFTAQSLHTIFRTDVQDPEAWYFCLRITPEDNICLKEFISQKASPSAGTPLRNAASFPVPYPPLPEMSLLLLFILSVRLFWEHASFGGKQICSDFYSPAVSPPVWYI